MWRMQVAMRFRLPRQLQPFLRDIISRSLTLSIRSPHTMTDVKENYVSSPNTPKRSSKKRLADSDVSPETSASSQSAEGNDYSTASSTTFTQKLSQFALQTTATVRKTRRTTKEQTAGTASVVVTEETTKASRSRNTSPKKSSSSPRKQKPIQMKLETPHPAPENWRETYDLIKEMRKLIVAPVDNMGCASAMEIDADPQTKRFSTLISLMLSSQTKDEVTHAAIQNLRRDLGELTIDNLLSASDETIEGAICKVGFWRRKTKYIKQAAQKLKDEFGSDVPKTVDELCSLPGVGPKMAFLALQSAWNLNHGIGVDVHVHRITNRLGWHKPPTTTPEQTRLNLQSWLPLDLHAEINPLLVGFGQTICVPVGPRCDTCVLSSRGLCPSARVVKPKPNRRRKEIAKAEDGKLAADVPSSSAPKIEIEIEAVQLIKE